MLKKYSDLIVLMLFFIFSPLTILGQCAGSATPKVICDINDPKYQTLNLFSLLDGTPIPGGTWSDNNNLRGLDPVTGILNAQLLRDSGNYIYTYTAPDVPGCANNTAELTLTIGPYAGIGVEATVCGRPSDFNLFTAFDSKVMGPHANGTWKDAAGNKVNSTIEIGKVKQKTTLHYTYTLGAIQACPSNILTAAVAVTILRKPEPGTPTDLVLCGTTDLSGYTNLDLHDLLADEDFGGDWRGPDITSRTDHNVNLQDIFDRSGPGEYVFEYTVYAVPNNHICDDETVSIKITLESRLDFTGAKINVLKDICEDEIANATYRATITEGPVRVPDGEYEITYSVAGPTRGSETVTANFKNGEVHFPVSSSYLKSVGEFNITVTKIVSTSSKGSCVDIFAPFSTILTIYPLPRLTNATITANPVCQNTIARILINAPQLLDGNYRISYTLKSDNQVTPLLANITAVGGEAIFEIPANLIVKSGIAIITITDIINITNPAPQCRNSANVSGNLRINPLPDATTVKITVDNDCLNKRFLAKVSGLGNISAATLFYTLSESNLSTLQSVSLIVSNGDASFAIPSNLLVNPGYTTISVSNLTNETSGCSTTLTNTFVRFLINSIPLAPVVVSPSIFCKSEGTTVANLVPNGINYKWYNSPTATVALLNSDLVIGADYYVREISETGCISEATKTTIIVNDTPEPSLNTAGELFCGLDNPKISDLSQRTNAAATVVWYDAPENGNIVTSTALLTDKTTYYGFDFSTLTNCISANHIKVSVSLYDCNITEYAFFIPDGFSPNGDGVNDTFVITDIDYLYPDYKLEILNRYGNIMFKGNRNTATWDGRSSQAIGGEGIAPNGVYFYVIHFNKDNKPPKQGRLYLNR